MSVPVQRTYPVVYGGWIGGLIALLVLIAVFVMWLTNMIEPKLALVLGGLALAILLR
jgi:hypothetical protein